MLDASRWNDGRLRESGRRVAVWAAVLICHVGFLVLFVEPVSDDSKASTMASNLSQALQLRFIARQNPSPSPGGSVGSRPIVEHRRDASMPKTPSAKASVAPHPVVPPSPPAARQSAMPPTPLSAVGASTMPPLPDERAPALGSDTGSDSDGGFQACLRDAQQGSDVHGVPGSDKALVHDIRLVDPMDQGIGAAVRSVQRLFGVKSRQCIDVETWHSLTPQELSARHISPDEVDRENEKYRCNDPPGLHF